MLAKGVSAFGSTKLNPAGSVSFAYAQSTSPPTEPANKSEASSLAHRMRLRCGNSRGLSVHFFAGMGEMNREGLLLTSSKRLLKLELHLILRLAMIRQLRNHSPCPQRNVREAR